MELCDYIEAAIKVTGTGTGLAAMLGIDASELAEAKGHRRGLPNRVAEKLAEMLHCPPGEVLTASDTIFAKEMAHYIQKSTPCERCASSNDCPYPNEKSCPNFIDFRKH